MSKPTLKLIADTLLYDGWVVGRLETKIPATIRQKVEDLILFSETDYDAGYEAGREDGYEDGRQDGYEDGYAAAGGEDAA